MGAGQLTVTALPGLPLIGENDDLCAIIFAALEESGISLLDDDILVVAQKIISKAEGRVVSLSSITATEEACRLAKATDKEPAIVQLILDESTQILRHRPGVLIAEHKQGYVLANAGIDRSNVDSDSDQVLLLPEDSNASAARLRAQIETHSGKTLGVVIADSVGRAWRMGTTGMALGSSGITALANLRGDRDLFGRELQVSEHALADSIAAAAELLLGEANEATPVVLLRGLHLADQTQDASILFRPAHEDMFR